MKISLSSLRDQVNLRGHNITVTDQQLTNLALIIKNIIDDSADKHLLKLRQI